MRGTEDAAEDLFHRHVKRETPDGLAALASRYGLGASQRAQLAAMLAALAGDPRAPTSVRDPARALDVHVADSLVALELEAVRTARRLADVGSGAGLPGAVLAVALAPCDVALVESQATKCAFVRELLTAAGIVNAAVVCARAEDWREGIGAQDVVTARALARQPVVLEYAAPLLALGGVLVDWRGRRDGEEERAAARAASELGMELVEVRRTEPFEGARQHHLHVFAKRSQTPARFPRRAGLARKRPLGAPPRRDHR